MAEMEHIISFNSSTCDWHGAVCEVCQQNTASEMITVVETYSLELYAKLLKSETWRNQGGVACCDDCKSYVYDNLTVKDKYW